MSERKNVLITGASRGIGAAAARLFARQGWGVGIGCHSALDRAQALAEELGDLGVPVRVYPADVARREEVQGMVDAFLRDFGTLDVLVCNAGIARQELFTDITEAGWREMLGVNLDGVFYCCQAVLPHMIHRKQGKLITLSSMWGQVGASCEVAYSAAKAGVIGLTKALAKEVGPSGITVNCVAPGLIETEMNRNLSPETKAALAEDTPLERLGTPEDVARAIWFLASPAGDFFTGQVLAPNGGWVI
ncbi:MAG TPA: 3-oxoacyl-ACP reductase FabG [Candidatus Evtepia faecigallinarum]|nr:3-oxoacyl-ACP reductase FabG [Candidatus Evtepia faecigallinarum]